MDITTPSDIDLLQEKGFNLEKVIGDGCYSKVFKALHVPRGSKYPIVLACKVIDTSTAPSDYKTKFLPRELEILIRVNHPHIIPVTSIFQRQAKFFIFMRFGENGDLYDFVSHNGRIPEKQSRLWMRQLISALNYIHTLNIAHRDLKCENILITSNYNVKLTDFGFARTVQRRGTDILSETYCGTLSYAAPEILKGLPYLPKLADMWSMGIIMYTMLNQSLPFKENTVKELYEKQVQVTTSLFCQDDSLLSNMVKIKKQWRFRSSVVNELSPQCMKQVSELMEPEAKARPSAASVFNGPWIGMDQRLARSNFGQQFDHHEIHERAWCLGDDHYGPINLAELTYVEESLLKKAAAAEKRTRYGEDNTSDALSLAPTNMQNKNAGLNVLKSCTTVEPLKESLQLLCD